MDWVVESEEKAALIFRSGLAAGMWLTVLISFTSLALNTSGCYSLFGILVLFNGLVFLTGVNISDPVFPLLPSLVPGERKVLFKPRIIRFIPEVRTSVPGTPLCL